MVADADPDRLLLLGLNASASIRATRGALRHRRPGRAELALTVVWGGPQVPAKTDNIARLRPASTATRQKAAIGAGRERRIL